MKILLASLIVFVCASIASAQEPNATVGKKPTTTIILSYEKTDASQFGYDSLDSGFSLSIAYRFSDRWEGFIAGEISDAQKHYVGNGHHLAGSLGARFYINDTIYLTAGPIIGHDKNSQYSKYAYRVFIGIGIKSAGIVATVTAFAPPTNLDVDLNQVRGLNLLVERFQPLFGPVKAYASFQGSLASFNATGGDPAARFTGASWKGRAGFVLTF